jgi:diguanylate cyclase (GGDEF)-like protein
MPHAAKPFDAELEREFQASRRAALADINASTYLMVAALVMSFSFWDWYVDPRNWLMALPIRLAGALIAVGMGLTQKWSGRVDWAPRIAKIRFAAVTLAIAGALLVLDQGYEFGIAGLVSVVLIGPYLSLDRRDLLDLFALPAVCVALILVFGNLERFAVVNSTVFLLLAVLVSFILARVFETAHRKAFLLEQQLKREARTDGLTGLANRRAMEAAATRELKLARRDGRDVAVALLDIDHFKRVNDRFGHEAGDKVLQSMASAIKACMRETDFVARWGGEEFLVLLPGADTAAAVQLAERIRVSLSDTTHDVPGLGTVTMSAGVAAMSGACEDATTTRWTNMVRLADAALYRAKAEGRNRVCAAADVALPANATPQP